MSCKGFYADVSFINNSTVSKTSKDKDMLETLKMSYEMYKRSQVKSFVLFYNDSEWGRNKYKLVTNPYQPLKVVQIYFATATFDENVKDVSVTLADQLGAIGGTMGLFAGFSFLSALEIVYFLIKYLISVVTRKHDRM